MLRSSPFLPVAILLAMFAPSVLATEQLGPTHRIIEPDLLEEIGATLRKKEQSGEIARLQAEAIERSKRSADTPRPVDTVVRTVMPRTFYWDPTVRAKNDIRDYDGNLVVSAGQSVNPLDYVSLSKHLVFFDGRDEDQVAMALGLLRHYDGRVKPIMTGGSVRELTQRWQVQVFFDQGGTLVTKLGIRQVPAMVSQEGKRLRIDELGVPK